MKIALLGTAYPFKGGGISTFNERLMEEFLAQGHEVEIVNFTTQYPSFLYPGKTQYSSEEPPKNLKITRKLSSINPLTWVSTGLYLKNQNFDIIIVRYWLPFMGPAFGTTLRIAKTNKLSKIICIADNIIPHESRIGDKQFTKYFISVPHYFITMSRQVMKDLNKFVPLKPVIFHPHPLYDNFGDPISRETALATLGLDENKNYALFFGFIRKYKGLDLLLEAMNSPIIKDKNIHLIIAGEHFESAQPYEDYIEQYGLKDRVHLFTEFIPNNKVRAFFSAANLVVQPYKSATQSGITQIAYHFNKPMVVTNVGGLAENVPHGKVGFVVPPDADSIRQSIVDYFDQDLEQKMSTTVSEYKKTFSWKSLTDTMLSFLDKD